MVWMKLDGVIELNNGNYIAFFTWATEKMFHVLIILTHLFESYYTCFKDKENGLLKVLLFNVFKCFIHYRKKQLFKCFLTSFKITQTRCYLCMCVWDCLRDTVKLKYKVKYVYIF